jgi:hypothetical protein
MKSITHMNKKKKLRLALIIAMNIPLVGCWVDDPGPPPPPPEEKVDRTMTITTLAAGLPADNRAFDPEFLLDTGTPQWFIEKVSDDFQACESYRRVTLTSFPAGRQGLMINGENENPTGCIAWGTLLLGTEAVKVSIWLGENSEEALVDARVSYFDPSQGNEDVYQNMVRNDSTKQQINDLFWYRYEATIPASAQGWGGVVITQQSSNNLYLNGLVALDESSGSLKKLQSLGSMAKMVSQAAESYPITSTMKNSLKHRQEVIQE